jgi:hypothetical protein
MINRTSKRRHYGSYWYYKKDTGTRRSSVRFILFVSVLLVVQLDVLVLIKAAAAREESNNRYIIIGVSGGLQKGFPDHSKLDFFSVDEEEEEYDNVIRGVFLGRALVRGYKAYLDVMEPTHRQYISSDDQQIQQKQPLINSNVIPTGCWKHANEYWMYLVDSRQGKHLLFASLRHFSHHGA